MTVRYVPQLETYDLPARYPDALGMGSPARAYKGVEAARRRGGGGPPAA